MDIKTYYSKLPPRKKKRDKKSRSWILYLVLALAAVAVILKCSGIFGKEGDGETEQTETTKWDPITPEEVVKVTPDNSPDNPKFIKVSFTEDEYKNSPTYSEKVIRDSITVAEFKEQGVKVSIDSYNLHNAEDEVKVQVLPKKTDPTYGNELYTYNVSLASGQSKFGTDVEVTLPIHNGKDAVRNVLWYNKEKKEWEEVYYTMAEDGKSCTAYVDHFSDFSIEEVSVEDLRKMGKKLSDLYANGSVFVELNADVNSRALLPVALVPTPVFEQIVRRQTESAKGIFEMLQKGGGIPMNAGLAESLDLFGQGVDYASTGITIGQLANLLGDNLTNNMAGGVLTFAGGVILAVRLLDMQKRGVDPVKIVDDNYWALISYYLGSRGALAAIAGLPGVATVCGALCVGIFAVTTVSSLHEKFVSKFYPFGTPETIEEGAYLQYLQTPTTDVLKKLGVKSDVPLKGTGEGWAEAIKAIFEANKGVMKVEQLGEKIAELYKSYINYFWVDMDPQVQREYWRKYVDYAANEWYTQYKSYISAPGLPSQQEEYSRLCSIIDKSGNKKISILGNISVEPMDDEGFTKVWHEIKFNDNYIRSNVKEYQRRALENLAKHTNKIIYKLIEDEQRNNILDAKRMLRDEVLPMMNTTLWFYAKDMELKDKEPIDHSIYYGYNPQTKETNHDLLSKWEFLGDKKPRFEANYYEGTFYCLDLKSYTKLDELGKSNVFHYLQYGAPDSVKITPAADTKLGVAYGRVDFKDKQPYLTKGRHRVVKERGFRVPIKFNEKYELKAFSGIWLLEELMGKYTPSEWVLGLVYMEDDNEFGEYEGPGSNFENKNRWLEIKHFDFNKKTGVLTIDFKKNNPERGQGTATFYVDNNDCLVMKNAGGTYHFIRFTEEKRKKNDEMYIEEQKRKAKEREKQQKQMKEDQKKYSIIPPGDED